MRNSQYLPAWTLQLLGVFLLLGSAGYWAVTGNESALFVGAAISLIGLGTYQGFRISVKVRAEDDDRDR